MTFDEAFNKLMGFEGGFSNHPNDPGLQTMYGITISVARQHGYSGDMRALPVELAKAIYRKSYWDRVRADELPEVIRYAVFDGAVNSGPGQAVRWLQRALPVAADGLIGPVTIATANAVDPYKLLAQMLGQRLRFMTDLNTWPSFSRGWARRVAELLCA